MKLAKLVQVDNWFSRSINLERDGSSLDAINAYVPTSTSIKTLKSILATFNDQKISRSWSLIGPYGSGKSSFGIFLNALLQPSNTDQFKLAIEKIKEIDEEVAKAFFKKLNKCDGCFNILLTGSYDGLTKKLFDSIAQSLSASLLEKKYKLKIQKYYDEHSHQPQSSNVIEILHLLRNSLKDSKFKFKGITITIDELGKHVEYAGSNQKDGDIYILQELAEFCVKGSSMPIFFSVMLHQAIEFYAKDLDKDTKNEWRKIQGRFEEISFIEGPEQSMRVIAKALKHNLNKNQHAKIKKDLKIPVQALLTLKIFPNITKIREGVNFFSEVFPFHPLTAFILPLLAQKLAQNERTVFTFLGSSETFGFQDLINEFDFPDAVMPHHIFDYFVNHQGSYIFDHLTHRRWIEVLNAIDRAGDHDEEGLKILKTIGLLNIIGSIANLRSSHDLLSIIFGSKILKKAIVSLEKKSLITYRKHNDEYRVWQGSDFDLEEALNRELDQFEDFDIAHELNNLVSPLPLVAKKYSIESHTLRYFESSYISDLSFMEMDENSYTSKPQLFIILNQNRVKQKVLADKYSLLPKNILIIEVNSKDKFEGNAKELKALRNIYLNSEKITNDPIAKKEISSQIDHLERMLTNSLKNISQSTDSKWIHKGKSLNIKDLLDIQAHLSRILEDIFHSSPILKNELINRDNISAQGQSARTKLIKMMGNRENRMHPGLGYDQDKFPPDKTIFNAIFNQLKLYQKADPGYIFAYPKKNHPLFPTYEFIKKFLSKDEPVSYLELCNELSKPPYGIKKGLHPIIFFGFYYSVEANMAMYEDGIFMPYLDDEAVDRIVRKGDHFSFQLHTFKDQDKLISAYSDLFLKQESKNILTIVRAFTRQMKALPEFTLQTRNSARISNKAIKLRSAFDSAKSPHDLFTNDIPKALGYKQSDLTNSKKLNNFINDLNKVMTELKSCYSKMIEEQRIKFAQIFGFDTDDSMQEMQSNIKERYLSIEEYTIDNLSLKPFLTRLLSDIDPEIWFEGILTILENTNPRKWRDETLLEADIKLKNFAERIRDIEMLKSYQSQKSSSSDQDIFGLRVTNHGKENNIDKIITLDTKEKQEYELISEELETILKKGGFKDKDKQIAALVAKINEIENVSLQKSKTTLKLIKNDNDE